MLTPPQLNCDLACAHYGMEVGPEGHLERRIVWNLMHYLQACDFEIVGVDDDEYLKTSDPLEAMEVIFNVSQSALHFRKPKFKTHVVDIVCGNGVDCIVDYSYTVGDLDHWVTAMEGFKEEDYL